MKKWFVRFHATMIDFDVGEWTDQIETIVEANSADEVYTKVFAKHGWVRMSLIRLATDTDIWLVGFNEKTEKFTKRIWK